MRTRSLAASLLAGAVLALLTVPAAASPVASRNTMRAFGSEEELAALFGKWQAEYKRRNSQAQDRAVKQAAGPNIGLAPAAGAPALADSVTNVQHAGVDEGGIVKVHGEHLVILRRGRLFTVAIRNGGLKPVAMADAYGGSIDPRQAWYDEMLIWGDTIVVIGYSYARGGTELGFFEISSAGGLRHKTTYHLRANDYYSSRNYASRLIGSRLVLYSPLHINLWRGDPMLSLPAARKWLPDAPAGEFERVAPATRIYRSDEELDPFQGAALHTVYLCDLAQAEPEFKSTAVLGLPGRVFYVSPDSVFIWTTAFRRAASAAPPGSALFRMPLDGTAPSGLKTAGSPVDQFSFLQDQDDFLNVLVRSTGRGDGMWAAEVDSGDLALLRVHLGSFSDGKESAPRSGYRPLPAVEGHSLQNRFVGPYLLYGAGTGWYRPKPTLNSQVHALRYAAREKIHAVPLAHGVDRIEALGTDAVVVGTDGRDLHFTSLSLARQPEAVDRYTRTNAAQGETRSHGFYYRPESRSGGLVGLPVIGGGRSAAQQLRRESAALLFLENRSLQLSALGTLEASPDAAGQNDDCRASCVDWYGNSRPLFLRNRIFALMGYEIVEGALDGGRIRELRRISFAPRSVDRQKL